MNRIDMTGKVAVVNGASRGIGEAIARGLAACGAQLVLTSRRQESVQDVADAITADGGKAIARACHAGHMDEIDQLFEFVRSDIGRLDILINNAATNPYFGPATGLTPEAFDKTVDVNLKGPYFMSSRAVPLMAESGGGSIVNVASIAALMSLPGQAVYAMTKAGLVSVTKSFAKEYGSQGIRVNAILPGVVETKLAAAMVEDPSVQKWLSRLPAGRAGQPEDMVAGVLYLASDQAAYTTGTTLVMDGGATLG
jgi:NAD(P)-dependent dehydrogenase (short-subunit alcohol dehydrogenase family)